MDSTETLRFLAEQDLLKKQNEIASTQLRATELQKLKTDNQSKKPLIENPNLVTNFRFIDGLGIVHKGADGVQVVVIPTRYGGLHEMVRILAENSRIEKEGQSKKGEFLGLHSLAEDAGIKARTVYTNWGELKVAAAKSLAGKYLWFDAKKQRNKQMGYQIVYCD